MSKKGAVLSNTSFPDTAECKQAEEMLQKSEEKYRSLVYNVKLGIFRSTPEPAGRFLEINPAMEEITGYCREELLQMNVSDLYVHPQERESVLEEIASGAGKVTNELRFRKKDGTEIVISDTKVAVRDNAGKIIYFDGILTDITEHKQAEKTLKESEQKFRSVSEQSPNMIFINKKGRVVYANEKCEEVTGYKREEFYAPDFDFSTLSAPKSKGVVKTAYSRHMKNEEVAPYEYTLLTKDGKRIETILTTKLIEYEGETAILGTATSITERKRAEHELREAQEKLVRSEKLAAIGQLAGGIGHELRNPLGAIKNAVYYVKGKVSKSELGQKEPRVMEFLEIMEDEINASTKIISDLVGFSRVQKPSASPATIEKVIEDALSHMVIPENIELTKKLDADLPEVEIDSDQIHQVFANMITNAVQAMPEGGKLTVAAREKGRFLEVEIADTGCGIPGESVDKIFDPLFTTKAQGIGFGLAVCKAIIDRHEGNIEVKSKMGKGTTFNIKLPLKREQKSNIGGK